MSFRLKLAIEDKTFDLLDCLSMVEQKADAKGKPVSEVYFAGFLFIINGSDDDFLILWATDKTKKHDGTVTLYEWDQDVKVREISFKNAYVVEFYESFVIDPEEDFLKVTHMIDVYNDHMLEKIIKAHQQFVTNYLFMLNIISEQVTIDGIEHSNRW
jgi:hypothetical protein